MAIHAAPDAGAEGSPATATGTVAGLRAVVAADNELLRYGLAGILADLDQVENAEPAESASVAAESIAAGQAELLVLVAGNAVAGTLAQRADRAGCKVLVVLEGVSGTDLAQAANLPAHGFVLASEITRSQLGYVLDRLGRGEMPVPAPLARELLSYLRHNQGPQPRPHALTPREQQTLGLLAEGLSNRQIAAHLGISEHGAKRHVANLLAKLNCPNRTLVVAQAMREGLLDTPAQLPESPGGRSLAGRVRRRASRRKD